MMFNRKYCNTQDDIECNIPDESSLDSLYIHNVVFYVLYK